MHALAQPKSFCLLDWYVHRRDAYAIVYRPSVTALLKRLKYPAAAAVVASGLLYLLNQSQSLVTDPEALKHAFQLFVAVLGAVSLVPVLSALVEEVRIGCDTQRNVVIRKRSVWSSTYVCPISREAIISVCAREALARTRRRGPLYSTGYTWTVTLAGNPMLQGKDALCLDFQLERQRQRPLENRSFPPRVQEFVDAVSALTGIRVDPKPSIVDAQRSGRGWGTSRRIVFPSVQVSRHEVPMEDLPPEIRARVQSMANEAREKGVSGFTQEVTLKQEFKVMGKDGTIQTYNSIEDLPPEVRETIERMRNQGKLQ